MTEKERPAGEITEGLRDGSVYARDDAAEAFLKLVYAELHRQLIAICKKSGRDTHSKPPRWFTKRISD